MTGTSNHIAGILFPHQLFKTSAVLENTGTIYLVEEFLFFKQYKFHKQKIAFHRASMKAYEEYLTDLGKTVHYIEAIDEKSDIRNLLPYIKSQGIEKVHILDPTDNWLEKRIRSAAQDLEIQWFDNPLFRIFRTRLRSTKDWQRAVTQWREDVLQKNAKRDHDHWANDYGLPSSRCHHFLFAQQNQV